MSYHEWMLGVASVDRGTREYDRLILGLTLPCPDATLPLVLMSEHHHYRASLCYVNPSRQALFHSFDWLTLTGTYRQDAVLDRHLQH
jgi:hypothetical protein